MKNVKIFIKGMSCQHCEKHVADELLRVSGVMNVEVSAKTGEAYLKMEDFVKENSLKEAVRVAGYNAIKVKSK